MGGDRKRKEKEVVGNKTVALNSTRHSTSLERWEPRSCFERESSRDSSLTHRFFVVCFCTCACARACLGSWVFLTTGIRGITSRRVVVLDSDRQ